MNEEATEQVHCCLSLPRLELNLFFFSFVYMCVCVVFLYIRVAVLFQSNIPSTIAYIHRNTLTLTSTKARLFV